MEKYFMLYGGHCKQTRYRIIVWEQNMTREQFTKQHYKQSVLVS